MFACDIMQLDVIYIIIIICGTALAIVKIKGR
jgi:hypothetical protein